MNKNKKADFNVMQILVIGVIVLILLLVSSNKLLDLFTVFGKTGACQASILQASVVKSATLGASVSSQRCNDLPDLTIKSSDVVSNREINDYALKKKIADKMVDCWNMIGKGAVDPYHKFGGNEIYCLVCSDVVFDDDLIAEAAKENYQLKDMYYWMAANTIPSSKDSYFKTLFGFEPRSEYAVQLKGQDNPIDFNQQYVIVWTTEQSKLSKLGAAAIGGGSLTAGAAGGAAAGVGAVLLGAKIGAIAGIWAGPIGMVVGGAVGLAVGAAGGGAIGLYAINKIGDQTLDTGIHFVPKDQLSKSITFVDGTEKKFCTKLVNY